MKLHEAPVETETFREFMTVVGHLVRTGTDDGMPCSPAKLLVTTQGPAWVVEVIDPDRNRSIRILAGMLDDAIALVDSLLRSTNPPWSPISKVRALV